MPPFRRRAARVHWLCGLRAAAIGFLASVGTACHKTPTVLQPIECSDPCCAGSGNVDCAETPNVSCISDADICAAYTYGCSDGGKWTGEPDRPPYCGLVEAGNFFGTTVGSASSDGGGNADGGDAALVLDAGADANEPGDAAELDADGGPESSTADAGP